ncbi:MULTISPECIES: HDOD domain-containing protein [unclassified Pseudomonas]|uniref:HDOD domain-containing protein n=1 Tax=unclassified Pseudomonas TaxID=196821 RepID=UPI000D3736C0|nr:MULTISPECIES: HDOD domain-containing protein [unclassified Pseudomonas]RAU43253.1 HDOD domain-containing protein [Pseudomonas sp. RIT 409]RAU50297.1 HDOD domain-containing protein [Pseudomonas sp. RIT 412]
MSSMADKVQTDLTKAIEKDTLFLPTLPEVAMKIRLAAEDSEISIAELSKVIGSDTALSARLIKVVNSPLLRPNFEVSDVLTAVRRLGVNYSCNLAIGLVVEQMFHAKSEVVETKMRDIWKLSLQVAGVANFLSAHRPHLKPDKATLAGLIHLIGVLPILTYAEDNFELLADPISLNHVIERIHPIIGERLLHSWDFPEALAIVPRQFQNFDRVSEQADYVDLVQVATVHVHEATGRAYSNLDVIRMPAASQLGLDMADGRLIGQMNEAMTLLY